MNGVDLFIINAGVIYPNPDLDWQKEKETIYLEGLRKKAFRSKKDIIITDVKPGYVDTRLTKGKQGMFWIATPEKATEQIYEAIHHKHSQVYITRRWRLIAWFLKFVPNWIYDRFV